MCDKYKPTEQDLKASESFFNEMREVKTCGKSCEKPSILNRIVNAGTYVRWWELALVATAGHLATRFAVELSYFAPTAITALFVFWVVRLIFRCR